MTDPTSSDQSRDLVVHQFKNHLSVIVGFCDVLMRDLPDGDRRRDDVAEIQRAALAAVALLPRIPGAPPKIDG